MFEDKYWMHSAADAYYKPRILVCIPAYNEATTVANIILKAKKHASQIIVCDDGSTDNTQEVAKATEVTVIRHQKNKGYGAALKSLFRMAIQDNADVIVTLDSDGQHDPDDIPKLLDPVLNEGIDLVIGSRYLNREDNKKIPVIRNLGIKAITKFARIASYDDINDAQSGFRAYSKHALSNLQLGEDGMAISTEILLKAKENKLSIKEVPVSIRYDIEDSSTHNPVIHGSSILFSILHFITLRHPLLCYGLSGVILLIVSSIFAQQALDLFSQTRYVSTNMILISMGTTIVGIMLILTGVMIYSMDALLKGRV